MQDTLLGILKMLANVAIPLASFIRMSEDMQKNLDYPSKLSREHSHIAALIAHGQQRAKSFLAELGAEPPLEAAQGEIEMRIH